MKINNKNIDYYRTSNIGNTKVEVYVEKIELSNDLEKYEFIFKIDNSTTSHNKLSLIKDLYNLFLLVQSTLLEYIDKVVMNRLDVNKTIQLVIEPEDNNSIEANKKDKLYSYHLDRLAKEYTDVINNIFCTHEKKGNIHTLIFSKY